MKWDFYYPLKWVKSQPAVLTTSLTEHQKQTLWRGLKKLDPKQAKLIQSDADFLKLKQAFNATVVFTVEDKTRFIEAGKDR